MQFLESAVLVLQTRNEPTDLGEPFEGSVDVSELVCIERNE